MTTITVRRAAAFASAWDRARAEPPACVSDRYDAAVLGRSLVLTIVVCARAGADHYWEIDCGGKNVDVVDIVEMMIADGWDAIKVLVIQEKCMPRPMRIMDLRDCDGEMLDLSKADRRENDMDPQYPSDPPTFKIRSIEELQAWHALGRPLPQGSHDSGNTEPHKQRKLKYPDDPLGLVADKLGRAIADERRDTNGIRLEPVFVHVYSLGHSSVIKQLDKGLELLGCGAFHAAVECYGVEWSYGYNDYDETGLFSGPPKYCEMHEYKETHYAGDTSCTPSEFERWLQFLSRKDYKQEDPLDPAFPKRVPEMRETPAQFFGSARHPKYSDYLLPVTQEANIGETYDYKDWSRMWTEFETDDGDKVISRLGWWGDEYELLKNNCCFFSDHLLKILIGKPLPHWIFSLAKVGDGLTHGAIFVVDAAADGMHALLSNISSVGTVVAGAENGETENRELAGHKAPPWACCWCCGRWWCGQYESAPVVEPAVHDSSA